MVKYTTGEQLFLMNSQAFVYVCSLEVILAQIHEDIFHSYGPYARD